MASRIANPQPGLGGLRSSASSNNLRKAEKKDPKIFAKNEAKRS
jgi:hypothetical protein